MTSKQALREEDNEEKVFACYMDQQKASEWCFRHLFPFFSLSLFFRFNDVILPSALEANSIQKWKNNESMKFHLAFVVFFHDSNQ